MGLKGTWLLSCKCEWCGVIFEIDGQDLSDIDYTEQVVFMERLVRGRPNGLHNCDPPSSRIGLSYVVGARFQPARAGSPLEDGRNSGGNSSELDGNSGEEDGNFPRTPDGYINNCAIANGYDESDCQMCQGQCPDRQRFEP